MTGVVGLAGVSIVGGFAWLMHSQGSQIFSPHPPSPNVPTISRMSATPTSVSSPIGTTFYTYTGHSDIVEAVAWSPNGTRIASGGQDKTVQVWNPVDGSNVFTYRGHSGVVFRAAWSPDGKRIASCGGNGTVQIWDAADGSHVYTHPNGVSPKKVIIGSNTFYENLVGDVAWSPNGALIASVNFNAGFVQVWNPVDGYPMTYQGISESNVAWSPDGTRIAFGTDSGTVQIWNTADGSDVYTYRGHSAAVYAVVWLSDGTRIASASWDKTVQIWNALDGGNAYTYSGHSGIVDALTLSPDSKRIASGSYDKTVKVWQAT
jgi:WD40 repeat protein